jgi:catechol 2,3-dioxygenase-like lactoylglutathione lyase family enzyme
MSISGISHVTFVVKNLERTARFFCEGLGAEEVYDSKDKNFSISREKFFVLGGVWIAAMEGKPSTERTYRHIAFQVTEDELPKFELRLRSIGADIKPPRPRVEGEGKSLYFYDFDDHLFELHTGTLRQRLDRYADDFNSSLDAVAARQSA